MSKTASREFARIIRKFVLKGGTVVALGHVNKKPNADGEHDFSGTGDIVNDFDCAWMLKVVSTDASKLKTVCFRNTKRRGDVPAQVMYSYSAEDGLSTTEMLLTIEEVDASASFGIPQQVQIFPDSALIDAVKAAINKGVKTKTELGKEVQTMLGKSRNSVLSLIEKYTGTDPKVHHWTYNTKAHGAKFYRLLPAAIVADVPEPVRDSNMVDRYVPDPITVSELADF